MYCNPMCMSVIHPLSHPCPLCYTLHVCVHVGVVNRTGAKCSLPEHIYSNGGGGGGEAILLNILLAAY